MKERWTKVIREDDKYGRKTTYEFGVDKNIIIMSTHEKSVEATLVDVIITIKGRRSIFIADKKESTNLFFLSKTVEDYVDELTEKGYLVQ